MPAPNESNRKQKQRDDNAERTRGNRKGSIFTAMFHPIHDGENLSDEQTKKQETDIVERCIMLERIIQDNKKHERD